MIAQVNRVIGWIIIGLVIGWSVGTPFGTDRVLSANSLLGISGAVVGGVLYCMLSRWGLLIKRPMRALWGKAIARLSSRAAHGAESYTIS